MIDCNGTKASNASDGRRKLLRINALLTEYPELAPDYERAREVIRLFSKSGYYELTDRCNLRCEGCYFFLSEDGGKHGEEADLSTWLRLFRSEQERGVSMGYFVGAEPALEQQKLLAASEFIPYGNIGTNGTIRIDPDVPYRIQISMWGDEAVDTRLRGGNAFRKSLRNYEGDNRALVLYTFNRWNIQDTRKVVAACRDHGIKVTFNIFSPTRAYIDAVRVGMTDSRFMRLSSRSDNMELMPAQYAEVRDISSAMLEEYAETVLYSEAYNRYVTSPGALHYVDPVTGVAENCRSRIRGNLAMFNSRAEPIAAKCCTPAVECSHCRMYSGGWSGRLEPSFDDLVERSTFRDWLEMVGVIGSIFVNTPRFGAYESKQDIGSRSS